MFHGSTTSSRQCDARRGFTLAELLIVIAIIAVLIGILLPSLAAARRSASSVKCLASLKQLGSAFQQYAQENKRMFPVVRWTPLSGQITDPAPYNVERTWQDFISKYVHKKETGSDPDKYLEYQQGSVIWGCPSFSTDMFDKTDANKRYSTGYGMSMYALGPYYNGTTNPKGQRLSLGPLGASVSFLARDVPGLTPVPSVYSSPGKGQFFKMEQWGRRGPEKGLIACSNGFDLVASGSWDKAAEQSLTNVACQPASMGMTYPHPASITGSFVSVDGTRHLAPTNDKKKVMKTRGTNMLFVDGHAAAVTPREAWIATYGGGTDISQ